MNLKAIFEAYECGVKVGQAQVPGVLFRGSMPEAKLSGYDVETPEGRCFMLGFAQGLNARAVVTDRLGRITRLDR